MQKYFSTGKKFSITIVNDDFPCAVLPFLKEPHGATSLQSCILKRPEHARNHESLTNLQQPKSSMVWPPCLSSAALPPSPRRVVLPLFASLSPLPVFIQFLLCPSPGAEDLVNFPFIIYHDQKKIEN